MISFVHVRNESAPKISQSHVSHSRDFLCGTSHDHDSPTAYTYLQRLQPVKRPTIATRQASHKHQPLTLFVYVITMDDRTTLDKPATSTRLAPKSKSGEDKLQSTGIATKAKRSQAKITNKAEAKKPRRSNKIARPCHFMRLPPELRLNIYEYHFRNTLENIEHPLKQRKRRSVLGPSVPPKKLNGAKKALSILHTSHTLRIEALPLCIEVAKTVHKSMRAEINHLHPYWEMTCNEMVGAREAKAKRGVVDKPLDVRGLILKRQFGVVDKIHRALQLVESNVSEEIGGLIGEKGMELK